MTTPTFISGTVGLGSIRYYTQFDAYFYSIDNRPLTDLSANDAVIAGAGDAARRAVMMEQVGTATDSLIRFGSSRFLSGLALTNPSPNILRVGPGIDYESIAVNASDSRTVVKRAVFPFSTDFNIPSPGGGNSVIYLVQGRYVDFGSTSPATTLNYPIWDGTNNYLPTSLFNGELQISVLAGGTALTGAEVAPVPTTGWFPIYNCTVVGAGTSFTTVYNVSAPATFGMSSRVTSFSNIGGATTVAVGDTPSSSLADAATSGVIFGIHINSNINPYKPIKFTIAHSPTVINNAAAIRVKYQAVGAADLINAPSYTVNTQDNVAMGATIDTYNMFTTVNGIIPASAVQSAISLGKTRFTVAIERLGTDGADTNTGAFRIIDILAIQ